MSEIAYGHIYEAKLSGSDERTGSSTSAPSPASTSSSPRSRSGADKVMFQPVKMEYMDVGKKLKTQLRQTTDKDSAVHYQPGSGDHRPPSQRAHLRSSSLLEQDRQRSERGSVHGAVAGPRTAVQPGTDADAQALAGRPLEELLALAAARRDRR